MTVTKSHIAGRTRERLTIPSIVALSWLMLAEPIRAIGLQGTVTVVSAAALALLVLGSALRRGAPMPPVAMWAFVTYTLVSCLWQPLTREGLQNISVYLSFVCAVTIAMQMRIEHPLALLVRYRYAALVGVVPSLLLGLQDGRADGRVIGTGAFPMIAVIGLLATVLLPPGRWRLPIAIIFALAALASLSRSLIAVSVALLALPALSSAPGRSRRPLRIWAVRGALASMLALWGLRNYEPLASRFNVNDGGALLGVNVGTSGRLRIWSTLQTSFGNGDHLLGNGAGAAERLVTETFLVITQPHNDYLRIVYDFGYVGLGLWVVVLFMLLRRGFGMTRRSTSPTETRRGLLVLLPTALVAATSVIDNTVIYVFAMVPLGVLIGAGLRPQAPQTATGDLHGRGGEPRSRKTADRLAVS